MPIKDITNAAVSINTTNDNIVIRSVLETVRGGRTLDTTGFTPDVIPGGHIVIEETSTGILKPMPITGNAYAALPASHTYKGLTIGSILTAKPFAAIMTRGEANPNASVYTISSVLAAFKTAVPLITMNKD